MKKKKIKLSLIDIDGNAFALMSAFQRQALKEGWTQREIDKVLDKATGGDYDYLLWVLQQYCED